MARALEQGFTQQELSEGQRGLLSFRRLSRAQDASVAAALANNLYLDRTFAYSGKVDAALAALTVEEVNAALRKYIRPEGFVFAFAGDFKAAQAPDARSPSPAAPGGAPRPGAGTPPPGTAAPRPAPAPQPAPAGAR